MSDKKNWFGSSMDRRTLFKQLGLLGASVVVSRCAAVNGGGSELNGSTESGACVVTATDEVGPFPADGSNTAGDGNTEPLDFVYPDSVITRSNIAESISGVPLGVAIKLLDVNKTCEPIAGYYVYIWHCTPQGEYSAYSGQPGSGSHLRTETYLRGIQLTDENGYVRFITKYPGWYAGRAVHIHAEVYKSLDDTTPVLTTQFAFPSSVNDTVQMTSGYKGGAAKGMLQNSEDHVFADGPETQMLTIYGSINGYNATITLRIAA